MVTVYVVTGTTPTAARDAMDKPVRTDLGLFFDHASAEHHMRAVLAGRAKVPWVGLAVEERREPETAMHEAHSGAWK